MKLNSKIIKQLEIYLEQIDYGDIIIIKHGDKVTIDVRNRERILISDVSS